MQWFGAVITVLLSSLYFVHASVCSGLQQTDGQTLFVSIWTSLHWNAYQGS